MSKTSVRLSAADISSKWNRRTKAAVEDVVAGVGRVTESPAVAAIAKKEKMLANLTASVQDGRWERGLSRVTLQDWKTNTQAKVRQRLAGGVDGAAAKRASFDRWMVENLNQVLPTIASMPDMTLEDSVSRVRTMMEHMSNNRYKNS